jgi:hypothetical protein
VRFVDGAVLVVPIQASTKQVAVTRGLA